MDGGTPGNTFLREVSEEIGEATVRRIDDLADLPIELIPANVADIVPEQYIEGVTQAFSEAPNAASASNGLVVFRYWGDGAEELGKPWYSPFLYESADEARRQLALPTSNSGLNVSAFLIPADEPFLVGKARDMSDLPGFNSSSTGGGGQIYLADPSNAVYLRRIR
jgi:hypothetical protein